MQAIQQSQQKSMFAALYNADFRVYFVGQLVSTSGTWMQAVAQGWLVFNITQSNSWLGAVACAAGLPILLLSPFTGVVLDRAPLRHILLATQTAQMTLAFILAALVFVNQVQIWHVVVLAFLLGVTNAIDAPARQAIITEIVSRDNLQSGITLNSILFNASRAVGPAAAGVALVAVGAAWCFLLNGLSFLAVIASLLVIHMTGHKRQMSAAPPVTQLREGFRFVRGHATILPLLLLIANSAAFGIGTLALLPAYAGSILHSPKDGYAVLSTANGLGAVGAGFLVGWFMRRVGRPLTLSIMVGLTTLSLLFIAFSSNTTLSAFFSFVFGFALIMQFTIINTTIQQTVPGEFRGRVLSLYALFFSGISPFTALSFGLLANIYGLVPIFILCAILSGTFGVGILIWWASRRRLPITEHVV